jgi:hypothetical protein
MKFPFSEMPEQNLTGCTSAISNNPVTRNKHRRPSNENIARFEK